MGDFRSSSAESWNYCRTIIGAAGDHSGYHIGGIVFIGPHKVRHFQMQAAAHWTAQAAEAEPDGPALAAHNMSGPGVVA